MELSRIDRIYAKLPVTAKLADGSSVTISGVDVAALPVRSTPTGTTTWTASSYSAGVATVLLAGPDADSSGAIPIPDGGADLWIRVVDSPEVEAVKVERVIVEGGGAATVPAVTLPVTSVNGRTGGVVLTATDVGLGPAALTAAIDAEGLAQGWGSVADATATTKGVVKLAGDLAGTASAPTVPTLATKASKAAAPVVIPGLWCPAGALDSWKAARETAKTGSLIEVAMFGDSLLFGQTATGGATNNANNYSIAQKLRALSIAAGYADGGVGIRGYTDSASMNTVDAVEPIQVFSRTDTGCGVTSGSNVVTDTAVLATDLGRKVTPAAGFGATGFVGSVTPGVSFTMVTAQGGSTALNATSTTTTNVTLSGDGFNGTGGFYGPLFNATPTVANATQAGFTTVFQGKGTSVRIGYITQVSGAATFTYSVDGGAPVTVNTTTGTRTVAYATVTGLTAGVTHTVTVTVTVAGTLEVWAEWVNASGIVWHKQGLPGQQLAARLPYASNGAQQTAWMMGLGVGTSFNTEANLYAANTGPRNVKLAILYEGLNDMATSTSQADAINRAQAVSSAVGIFAELCRNAAIPGVVCLPQFAYWTNARSYMGLFRSALTEAAMSYSLPLVDLQLPVGPITSASTYGAVFGSGAHLNQAGYDAQASFLWNNLLGPNALV